MVVAVDATLNSRRAALNSVGLDVNAGMEGHESSMGNEKLVIEKRTEKTALVRRGR